MACLAALPAPVAPAVDAVLRSPEVHGTNELAMDNDDNLVIASIEPKAVFVMDINTGKVLKTYMHPLISGPDDVMSRPMRVRGLKHNTSVVMFPTHVRMNRNIANG